MNKKFIALTSTIALLLSPATSVLAEGDNPTTDSENTQTEEPTTTDGESTQTEEPTTTDGESTQTEEPTTTDEESTQTDVTIEDPKGGESDAKKPTYSGTKCSVSPLTDEDYFLEIPVDFTQKEAQDYNLDNVTLEFAVGFFATTEFNVTLTNPTLFIDGRTYRVHNYRGDGTKTEQEVIDTVAKNGKISMILHGGGDATVFIQDLGIVSSKSNGRKAALNTGVK